MNTTRNRIPSCKANQAPSNIRYHYMDNLRALAMIVGVFFHAAMAYMPILSKSYVLADPFGSTALEYLALYTHLFRMPLFMLVAGFFAHYILITRGGRGFIKNRLLRVTLPFVIFLPLSIIAIVAIIFKAAYLVDAKPPMLMFLIENAAPGSDTSHQSMSTFHLWFLYYLMVFYVLSLFWRYVFPFDITALVERCSPSIRTTILSVGVPLLIGLAFFMQANPPLAPADKLVPQLWAVLYYGTFFLIGWVFYGVQNLFDTLKKMSVALLFLSAFLYFFVFTLYPSSVSIESVFEPPKSHENTSQHLILAILQGAIATYASFALVLLGKKVLNLRSKVMRYLADASYWLYLSHIPIVMACHMVLIDVAMNVWSKYIIVCTVTLFTCLLSYQILVRHTPIGWMLNGKRSKPVEQRNSKEGTVTSRDFARL